MNPVHVPKEVHQDTPGHLWAHLFGSKPKQSLTSPLEKEDHPELDMSKEVDAKGIKSYQSLTGALQ